MRRMGSPAATIVLAASALFAAGCREHPTARSFDLARMRVQPRYEAYGASHFFADGKAMQRPPAGTIAREAPLDRTAGLAQRVPGTVTPAVLARGASRFEIFCAACHGKGGYGGSLVAANMDPPRPPSLRSPAVRAFTAGALYEVIVHGVGRMPPYASQLSEGDRWAVVAYVRALQKRPAALPFERADSERAAAIARRLSPRGGR